MMRGVVLRTLRPGNPISLAVQHRKDLVYMHERAKTEAVASGRRAVQPQYDGWLRIENAFADRAMCA